jgi:3-phenylpropionate/trans-cinnamate dioxygenase ferredoxin subunit
MQRWYKVYDFEKHGSEPQRLNTARTIDIEGIRLCMTRTEQGYFALDDKCPHAGARFGMGGYCENGLLVCPVHRYKFNVQTGQGLQGDYVKTYATVKREDGVYVALEKKWWQLF